VHGLSYLRNFDREIGSRNWLPGSPLIFQRVALLSERISARNFRFCRVNLSRFRRARSRRAVLQLHFPARRRHKRLGLLDRITRQRLYSHRPGRWWSSFGHAY